MAVKNKINPPAGGQISQPKAGRPWVENFKFSMGFSLIEIFVVIVLLGIVATIASSSLFSLLRGGSKTDIVKEVKQNGDYALTVMEIKIRNAVKIPTSQLCNGTLGNQFSITSFNPANSTYIDSTFGCNAQGALEETVDPLGLNTKRVLTNESVTIPSCATGISFTCTTSVTGAETVNILFTLKEKGSNKTVAETSTQTFQTQVTLRNK